MEIAYSYFFENTFYIYSRKKDDSYQLLLTLEDGTNPMSRFKHEVYAYALKKAYKCKITVSLLWLCASGKVYIFA